MSVNAFHYVNYAVMGEIIQLDLSAFPSNSKCGMLFDHRMNWEIYQPRIRFDVRAEREECGRLFNHQARALQDRLVRRSRTDRTRHHSIPEWEKVYQTEGQERRLLYQARVLSWGKEKSYYYAHKHSLLA